MANRFVDKLKGFAALPEAAVAALEAATTNTHGFKAKQDLIREGDQPGPVFVVLKGWACRYKILPNGLRQVMAFLVPGDCCDLHIGMLAEMDHSIQAVTSAEIATVSRAEMDQLLQDFPSVARAMYISQLVDEGILRSWIVSMGRRSSLERVAHLMCELYLRARTDGADGEEADDAVTVPLSQVILADALGMTPVHINRTLRTLREAGAMELQRRSLVVTDAVKLVRIAGFDENYLHRRLRQGARFT